MWVWLSFAQQWPWEPTIHEAFAVQDEEVRFRVSGLGSRGPEAKV